MSRPRTGTYAGLPTYPTGWGESPLRDLVDINPEALGAGTPGDFKFRYIDLSSVDRGVIHWDTVQEMIFRTAPSRARRATREGDTLFGTVRPSLQSHTHIGTAGGGPLVASTGFAVLRAGDRTCPDFVKHLVFSQVVTDQVRRLESGSNYPAVNEFDLATMIVPNPPEKEKVRIAEVLDTLDEAIRSVQMVLNKKNAALIGLLRSLFSPSGGGHVPTHRTALGDYPNTWEVVPLWECVRPNTIITYGIVQAGPHVPDGVPYIRTGDMSGDALTAEGLLRTATRIDQAYARSKVRTGEIVCAIRATVGKVLPVPPELDGANLTQGTARIAPAQNINPSFLLWAIRSPRVQREIGLTVKGTTFAEITLEALREIPIPQPRDREEQNKIAATLDGLDSEIRTERAQLTKLQSIKSGLTSDLLTGRVRTIHH